MKDLNHKFREVLQNKCRNRAVYMIKQFFDLTPLTELNNNNKSILFKLNIFFFWKQKNTYGDLSSNVKTKKCVTFEEFTLIYLFGFYLNGSRDHDHSVELH